MSGGGGEHPNSKPYQLRYADGDRFTLRGQGSARKEFDLAAAIRIADAEAGRGEQLTVVDPATETVLWIGQRAAR